MPPGPALAAMLAGIDLSGLCGFDAVTVLQAQHRQLNHETARLMRAMVEVGLSDFSPDDEPVRKAQPDEFSADEIRLALVWSRRTADRRLELAYDLVTRLPGVHAALGTGVIDEPKAWAFSAWTSDLSVEQARAVCKRLLPEASRLTTGQLIEKIKKFAIAIDPDWARRRYDSAVAERKVVGYRNPDGTANLGGYNLPLDHTVAASTRIEALAKSAKRAGHPGRIDHIRAELFLGMLEGTYSGLDDTVIIETLLATGSSVDADAASPTDAGTGTGPAADTEAAASTPIGDHADTDVPDAEAQGDDGDDESSDNGGGNGGGNGGAGRRQERVEVRVRLSTLLGLDDYPGEVAGWGPAHAELARKLVRINTGGQWRFALTDAEGQLLHTGITRHRPTGWVRTCSKGIVELQVPATLLDRLTPEQLGEWTGVITDLRRGTANQDQATARFAGDAGRRTPGAALRRYVQMRDRYCVLPTCRAPAHSTDADHTVDHALGGRTVEANLDAVCRHDHRLKHEGGWQLTQTEAGHFVWTSRLGHTYPVRPPPIIEPLPEPAPRGPLPVVWVRPDRGWEDSSIGPDPPEPPRPEPPPAPEIQPPF